MPDNGLLLLEKCQGDADAFMEQRQSFISLGLRSFSLMMS